jgi:Skp family chaperone for outer membrane proteins
MSKTICLLLAALLTFAFQGCTQHKVEVAPVEVKPIHITIDVNVKVDRALDNFFGDVDKAEQKIDKTSSTTQ